MGKSFGIVARSIVLDACFELEDILDEVHDLDKTPLEGSRDVLVHKESPSFGFDESVFSNPLDHFHILPMCLQPSSSPEYYAVEPVGNSLSCDVNVDLATRITFSICLVEMLIIFFPQVTFVGMMPPLIHIACT